MTKKQRRIKKGWRRLAQYARRKTARMRDAGMIPRWMYEHHKGMIGGMRCG